jgi:hypothetical protein
MRRLNFITIAFLVGMGAVVVYGQGDSAPKRTATMQMRSANLALDLRLPKARIPIGETAWIGLIVENLSQIEIPFPREGWAHVEGKNGEPPTTLAQRQFTHTLRPGEQEVMLTGFVPIINSGDYSVRRYDLAKLYDLSKPGKYSVYVELRDDLASKNNAGIWVRSNTVTFEIQAPTR